MYMYMDEQVFGVWEVIKNPESKVKVDGLCGKNEWEIFWFIDISQELNLLVTDFFFFKF